MGLEINNDIFRLQNLSVDGMSRREYRLHLIVLGLFFIGLIVVCVGGMLQSLWAAERVAELEVSVADYS
jgi:hypothetical protein